MSLSARLREFLDSHQACYTVTTHRPAFTANEVASAEHLPAREMAKTVVAFGDNQYHMLVVPASRHLDLREVQYALGLKHVRLATEIELSALFLIANSVPCRPSGNFTISPCISTGFWPTRRLSPSTVARIRTRFICAWPISMNSWHRR
jgi:hypothetical protein